MGCVRMVLQAVPRCPYKGVGGPDRVYEYFFCEVLQMLAKQIDLKRVIIIICLQLG